MERTRIDLMQDWTFLKSGDPSLQINLPHTWNALDGQDGGQDYWRGMCTYRKSFPLPVFDAGSQQVYLVFDGVNASARVLLNGEEVGTHAGGYATFRFQITPYLQEENELTVEVDNSVNDQVYPQKADFTFYGGIYRDVYLLIVNKAHFDLDDYGGPGLYATPTVDGTDGKLTVRTRHTGENAWVSVWLTDDKGTVAGEGTGEEVVMNVPMVHLWNGRQDPYLYKVTADLRVGNEVVDTVSTRIGFRTFKADAREGFKLNGKPYPLRGVSRHQDRKGKGNAITPAEQKEDLDLICEIGANAVRLAHYQQNQYFYDLCDERGLIVWAEIPYISEHMHGGRENAVSQLTELITQNYNHPSIVCWGISNEITISTKNKKEMLKEHRKLNDLAHQLDPGRYTTLACYAMCTPFHKVAHITDLVGWNLYLGWYTPGLFLNDWWIRFFHLVCPDRALAFSEYGCEGMPNLHSKKPRRGDQTEEYQALYHEFMVRCFSRHPWLWGTFVWNMFDFAADARDQGGEPGMNHKGLITFDRKTKKDAFYLYKACWSEEPFVHICGRRRRNREEETTEIKVYSNQSKIRLFVDGRKIAEKTGDKVFRFQVPLQGTICVEARAGKLKDKASFTKVISPDPDYQLHKKSKKSANWV